MKKLKIILLLLISGYHLTYSQSIEIVRTDVDSSRQNIVTATYLFGFDIYAQDIQSCNGVAFELRYNQTDYVKFSGWQNGDFGKYGNAQVVQGKTQDNKGRIIVGTGTGIPLGNLGIDNPKVIHLEFAVTQSAAHFSFITFEFIQPKATVFIDDLGQKIDLEAAPETFRIHSFIDVWPGDANNDGSVTFDDFNQINLYMGMGSATKNFRSFKRPQASTIWKPQRVLAWDSAEVSYADSDGNGDITSTDHLIVTYNIDKTRSGGGIIENSNNSQDDNLPENAKLIPVYAYAENDYIGAAGEIYIDVNKSDILGIKAGDIIDEAYNSYHFDNDTKILTVSITNRNKQVIDQNGVLFYVALKENSEISNVEAVELNAITSYGQIFQLNKMTSVIEEGSLNTVIFDGEYVYLPAEYKNSKIAISDLYGNIVLKCDDKETIYIGNLNTGTYFIKVINQNSVINKKINIVK